MDPHMIEHCSLEYDDLIKKRRLALVHSNYVHLPQINVAKAFNRKVTTKPKFDIALLDLGFSSYQLEDDRGFSYMSEDQRLDIRYDTSLEDTSTAHDILNNSTEFDLALIFQKFCEEKFAV
jgi:16S rRNA C1402 N4-methylase RsmH